MDPFNIKSDNVNNAEDRPLKRPKCSELRVWQRYEWEFPCFFFAA